jgi:hypothetical protein
MHTILLSHDITTCQLLHFGPHCPTIREHNCTKWLHMILSCDIPVVLDNMMVQGSTVAYDFLHVSDSEEFLTALLNTEYGMDWLCSIVCSLMVWPWMLKTCRNWRVIIL